LAANRNTRQLYKKLAKFKYEMLHDENYHCQYFEKGDGILLITKS